MGENSENKTRLTTEIDIRSYLYSNGKKKQKKNTQSEQFKYSIENLLKKHNDTPTHKYMTYYFSGLIHALGIYCLFSKRI